MKNEVKYCPQCGYTWTEDCDFCPSCDNDIIGFDHMDGYTDDSGNCFSDADPGL